MVIKPETALCSDGESGITIIEEGSVWVWNDEATNMIGFGPPMRGFYNYKKYRMSDFPEMTETIREVTEANSRRATAIEEMLVRIIVRMD